MTDRNKFHVGRKVLYNPTAAEITASGAGPWLAWITKINADGTCTLMAVIPAGTTAAKTSVPRGTGGHTFSFQAGSASV